MLQITLLVFEPYNLPSCSLSTITINKDTYRAAPACVSVLLPGSSVFARKNVKCGDTLIVRRDGSLALAIKNPIPPKGNDGKKISKIWRYDVKLKGILFYMSELVQPVYYITF